MQDDPRVIKAASSIMDMMMGGDRSWRERVDWTDALGDTFLNSADWATAIAYARAALEAGTVREEAAPQPILAALDAHEAGTVRVSNDPTPETLELVARELSKPYVHDWVQRSIFDLSDEKIRERLESEWPKLLPEATKALDTLRSRDALFKIANGLRGIGDEPLSEEDGDALESAIELLAAMAVLASRPTGEE